MAGKKWNGVYDLAKDSLIYGIGESINRIAQLAVIPIATSILAPDQYGLYALALFFVIIFKTVISAGTGAGLGVVYFDSEETHYRNSIVSTNIVFCAATSLVSFFLFFAAVFPAKYLFDASSQVIFYAFLALLIASAQAVYNPALLKTKFDRNPEKYFLITIPSFLAGISFGILLLVYSDFGGASLLYGQIVSSILCMVLIRYFGVQFKRFEYDDEKRTKLTKASLPFLPGIFMMIAVSSLSPLMLATFSNLHEAGIYAVGAQFGNVMGIAVSAATTAWFPFFMAYKLKPDDGEAAIVAARRLYIAVFGVGVIIVVFISKFVIGLFTDPAYANSARIFVLVSCSHVLLGMWSFLLPTIYFNNKTKLVLYPQIASGIITILSQYLLIGYFGAQGAAFGVIIGMATLNLVQISVNYRINGAYSLGNAATFVIFLVVTILFLICYAANFQGIDLSV